MDRIENIWKKIPKSLWRFIIVGGIGTIVNLLIYQVCIWNKIFWLVSWVIAFSFCAIENYILNQKWSFIEKDDTHLNLIKFIKYYGVNLIGQVFSLSVLALFILFFGQTYSIIGEGLGIITAFVINYLFSAFFIFYKRENEGLFRTSTIFDKQIKLNFVIPTYNEAGNIEILLKQIQTVCDENSYIYKVIIVDDNSPDHTADLVCNNPNVQLFERTEKLGNGSAYKYGFKNIDQDADYIVMMDADLSHDPMELPSFIKKLEEGYDCVQGSRRVKGGKIEGWNWTRHAISYISSIITYPITHLKDPNGSFKVFRRELLENINYDNLADNFGFVIELIVAFKRKSYKLFEIPIIFHKRNAGVSKLSGKEIKQNIKLYFKLYLSEITV